ncbi:hypothetical protein IFM47457_05936, partial [Aspergillus lentulus]
ASPSTATIAAPVPTNVAQGTDSDSGNTILSKMGISMGISLNDFYFLHPEIDANCTDLMLGIAYCVEAVGGIPFRVLHHLCSILLLEPWHRVELRIPADRNTYCVAGPTTFTSTTTPASSTATTGAVPTETGIISTCKTYYTAVEGDSCWSIEQAYGVRADDFVSWNLAVGEDCSGLWLGYSYCVGV